jgi:hypothetical protein
MHKLLHEPLLHFLLLGAALFVVFGVVDKRPSDEPGHIVITPGQIASLTAGFTRTWQRPPTAEELAGLIHDAIREEVYYREAMALGLERDDSIIRRRLRQKMEFIAEDVAALAEPTDEELQAYLHAHPDTFRLEHRFSFRHVYLNPERRRASLTDDTAQLLTTLHQAGDQVDIAALGDAFLLEHEFEGVPGSEVAKLFGEPFATALGTLGPEQWQGPVPSGYGVHLVFVSARTEGRVPALEEARDAVRREWANVQQQHAQETFYQRLLKRYTVTIEGVEPEAEQKKWMGAK